MTPEPDLRLVEKASKWLTPRFDTIPPQLKDADRWLLWDEDGAGRKVPRAIGRPDRNVDGTNPLNWGSFAKFSAANVKLKGPGFALGPVEGGPTFAGIDLDGCRNAQTGGIQNWAQKIIDTVSSYTEISPSATGIKIFCHGALRPEDDTQGKVYQLEIYDRVRYFTVTGHHLPGTPRTVESRETLLRELYQRQQSKDLVELTKLFGLYNGHHGEWVDIACPWAHEHSQKDHPRDAALHIKDGRVDGFQCFHASHKDKTLADVFKRFNLKGNREDFILTAKGGIATQSQENIRRALDKLEVKVSRDLFTQKPFITRAGKTLPFEDDVVVSLWLEADAKFGFRPSKDLFYDVVMDLSRRNTFHPVRDYLNGLKWDGVPRLDTWVIRHGKAKNTPLIRAQSAIVLIAAVRRIRQPGCKFDELLVLISRKQGTNKSSAIQALCPNDAWFSDDLPLNVDAKQIIERTCGKWIIEAAELNGFGKRELDHLKASLSRQVDGPVRLAYGRLPVEVPRQFINIGTTNLDQFLKDKTGNRRFWPIEVQEFDTAAIRRDRDQLWAEAAHREASGESIRLDASLWASAAREQEARQIDDPWVAILREFLQVDKPPDDDRPTFIKKDSPKWEPKDRVLLRDIWTTLGILPDRQDERSAERINAVMQLLGYEKKQARGRKNDKGEWVTEEDAQSAKRWCRIEEPDYSDAIGARDEEEVPF